MNCPVCDNVMNYRGIIMYSIFKPVVGEWWCSHCREYHYDEDWVIFK